ncbi:MAG: lipoprotein signal peptidase [Candidatus Homeothermus sp.]|nr:lipoprotein signal peptidase [Candidatus Homeothermus sp.]
MKLSKGAIATIIILGVLIIDQIVKIWVKTNMYLGQEFVITDWFRIYFIENNGMAFGMELGSKLFLTMFRIVAVGLLIYYICRIKNRTDIKTGYIVCCALITAGAAGNIIDSVFYGMIFNNPYPPEVAVMFPPEGGYAPVFHGRVVDMLYFPLFSFYWPDWVPFVGGDYFLFFQPIFNIADAAITVGILVLIIFYSKYLSLPVRENGGDAASGEEK